MKILKILSGLILFLAIALLIIGFTTPKQLSIQHTMEMNAPVDKIFSQVNNLKNWENWSPWYKLEPTMDLTYSDKPTGANSWYKWKGEKTMEGKLTIKKAVPNQRIETEIDFGEMGKVLAFGILKVKATAPKLPGELMPTRLATHLAKQ